MKKVLLSLCVMFVCLGVSIQAMAEEKATKDECVAMCEKAAQVARTKGMDEVSRQIADPNGPFVWKDSYIYLVNINTKQVAAHPIKPVLVGKDLSGIKDINGKMFFVEITNVASEKGSGWVDYMWPKPGEKKPVPKTSYVLRIPDQPYALVAGIYY
jgi:cytochrome c